MSLMKPVRLPYRAFPSCLPTRPTCPNPALLLHISAALGESHTGG